MYAKYPVFSTFETDFCTWIGREFGRKTGSQRERRPFSFIFVWFSPNFGLKFSPNPDEDLFFFFFWFSPGFAQKPLQIQVKSFFFDLYLISGKKSFQFQVLTLSLWFHISETAPSMQIPGYAPAFSRVLTSAKL